MQRYSDPHGVLESNDFVIQAHPFLRKWFFLNLDNMAYSEGWMNHKITNFELHEILLIYPN